MLSLDPPLVSWELGLLLEMAEDLGGAGRLEGLGLSSLSQPGHLGSSNLGLEHRGPGSEGGHILQHQWFLFRDTNWQHMDIHSSVDIY